MYAQEQLGDVVFVELPQAGRRSPGRGAGGGRIGEGRLRDLRPGLGEVTEANAALADDAGDVNAEPRARAGSSSWKLSNKSELDGLMDEAAYAAFVKSLG